MKLKFFAALFACLTFACPVFAAQGDPISLETQIIDVPTAETMDRYQASFLTRAYDHGTIMESIDFGVYPRINLGVSIAVHELLGSSSSVRVLDPDFQVKWKLYDGSLYLPAIAIGYDGRRYGYGYDHRRNYTKTKQYLDDRKRRLPYFFRARLSYPASTPPRGVNLSRFLILTTFTCSPAFFYHLADNFGLLAEWDNIRNIRDSRLNLGARITLHPSLALDAAVRRIGRGDESERILQLRYVTNF